MAGALLVGISYAKALAFALEKPLITVNHLEGHIHAVLLEEKQKGNFQIDFPLLALVVSGGHTHLFLAEQREHGWTYTNIGRTRDDAAGEAYDKVAKLLGLGYPGGPVIDALALHGNPKAVKFVPSQIKHGNRGTPKAEQTPYDFSFSGIKTAVLRYVELEGMRESITARQQALAGNRQAHGGRRAGALRQANAGSGGIFSARRGGRSGRQNVAGGAGARRAHAVCHWRRGGKSRIERDICKASGRGGTGGLFSFAKAFYRQRGHDRGSGIPQTPGKRFCRSRFFR